MFNLKRLAVVATLLGAATSTAHAQFVDLLDRIPDDANAVVVFNVAKIMQSPLAVKENWRDKHKESYNSGLVYLPPFATGMVLASNIDLEFMEPVWESSVVRMSQPVSLPDVARKRHGRLDTLGSNSAVALPSDAYIVSFGSGIYGAMSPANRQSVSRWVKEATAESRSVALSSYLKEAVAFTDDVGTEIIMAIDLEDIMTPQQIRARLESRESLKDKSVDLDELAQMLSSIRGLTLGVTIGDKPFGALKVDFGQDVSIIADFAKPLLLEALGGHGLIVPEFEGWDLRVSGQRIQIQGNLTADSMRKIFSVVEPPTQDHHNTTEQQVKTGSTPEETMAYASQAYFKSVQKLFDDLQIQKKDARTIGQFGVWFDKYAKKVDRLPMVNVDDEMLDYGAYVSAQLRNAAAAVKGIGMQSRAGQVNAVAATNPGGGYDGGFGNGYAGYRYGRYGAYGGGAYINPVQGDLMRQQSVRTQVRVNAKIGGAATVQGIFQEMENQTAATRRAMVKKYNLEF